VDYTQFSYAAWGADCRRPTGDGLYYSGEMFDPTLKMYNLRARYYNPANGRFNATDPYSGSSYDPQSLHKYLYCHADPVNMVDPLGLFTQIFGYAAEAEIQKIYAFDHSGDAYLFGKWSRLGGVNSVLFSLKPDILNLTRKRWLEIKPFTYNGIMDAKNAYVNYYLRFWAVGYYPEIDWKPSTSIVNVWGLPVFFWNAGGIVFYTDHADFGDKLVKVSSVAAALAFMKTAYGKQVIIGATLRTVPHMAMAAKRIDFERLNRHIGIAAMLAIGFGIM
jgi:RHS repeat-associated protein